MDWLGTCGHHTRQGSLAATTSLTSWLSACANECGSSRIFDTQSLVLLQMIRCLPYGLPNEP